jgi:hypothetical protein
MVVMKLKAIQEPIEKYASMGKHSESSQVWKSLNVRK